MKNKYGKFFKTYANLLPGVRDEIILVLPDYGPITWKIAYFEIYHQTKLGEKIFKKLEELKFI